MFLKNYDIKNLRYDIPAGVIDALVTIPIAMGYAQIAGLPAVYGLYSSLLPVLVSSFLTTSKHFAFGVDAAPNALLGTFIFEMGISFGSAEAVGVGKLMTLMTGLWLLLFYYIKAGSALRFISDSVMSGFISGICVSIIMMQVPKLFGGTAGRGELIELTEHLIEQAEQNFNMPSAVLGIGTVVLILLGKKFIPKVPVNVILMFVGAGAVYFYHIDKLGIAVLPSVKAGLPGFSVPDPEAIAGNVPNALVSSFSIAVVVLTETLLASSNQADKNGERLDNERELVSYTSMNIISSVCGGCPVSGSVSRSGIVEQLGARTQLFSVIATGVIALILLFFTGFIDDLPVPVLAGIVVAALIGSTEFENVGKLRKADKAEFTIFWVAFGSVLVLGTIYGVLIGIMLSFFNFTIKSSRPQSDFLGGIEGIQGLFSIKRNREAVPIKDVIIYQFLGQLFFANVDQLRREVERAIKPGTKIVIIDCRAVTSIDITAAEKITAMYDQLKKRGIKMYLARHSSKVNDQLRTYGAWELFDEGAVRLNISSILDDNGYKRPWPLEGRGSDQEKDRNQEIMDAVNGLVPNVSEPKDKMKRVEEFRWLYGNEAADKLDKFSDKVVSAIVKDGRFDSTMMHKGEIKMSKGAWNDTDEERLLDSIEMKLALRLRDSDIDKENFKKVMDQILNYHVTIDTSILRHDETMARYLVRKRMEIEDKYSKKYPECFSTFENGREKFREKYKDTQPELIDELDSIRQALLERKEEEEHSGSDGAASEKESSSERQKDGSEGKGEKNE